MTYIYLGYRIKLGKDNQVIEVPSRIGLCWVELFELGFIKILRNFVLEKVLYTTQREMRRTMIEITLRDIVQNDDTQRLNQVMYVLTK